MPPEQLLQVKPITEVNGLLEYSERTMRTIANHIRKGVDTYETRSAFVRRFLQGLEPWITVAEGNGGKMTKRISAYLFKTYGLDVPSRVMAGIGNFLNDEAPVGNLHYDQTNRFSWTAGDFGDHAACFLISRRNVLEAMQDEGAHALRFWKPVTKPVTGMAGAAYKGVGRAWVLPTKLGLPVVMNAYGPTLESYRARMRLIVPDAPTRMVMVNNRGQRDGMLYVNGGVGFLVGQEGDDYELDVDLDIALGSERPARCGDCMERHHRHDMHSVLRADGSGCAVCESCFNNYGDDAITGRYYPNTYLTPLFMAGPTEFNRTLGFAVSIREQYMVAPAEMYRIAKCPRCETFMHPRCMAYHIVEDGLNLRVCAACAREFPLECAHCGNFAALGTTCTCGNTSLRSRSY